MGSLQGRHALVTGAGSGIGRHAATVLAVNGARVSLCARRRDRIADVAATIAAAGRGAQAVAMDVTDATSIGAGLDEASAAFGPVDILINNAGVVGDKSLLDMPEDEWDRIHDTNLKGAWLCAREVAKRLIASGRGGVIVNVASVLGFAVQKGTGPYAASKAGLLHLTRAMAAEWARHNIRVNALAPGYVQTDMVDTFLASDRGKKLIAGVPQRRAGTVDDLTEPLLLLAGDGSAYMTGAVLTVDGGISLGTL
ncbi:MAG: glucose 1-dehydrogenase [Rhodospirillaceae bacterium]|nr:glucose 1-dehydrogenase [Rhodospirillaceae bacterium]